MLYPLVREATEEPVDVFSCGKRKVKPLRASRSLSETFPLH